MAIEAPRAFNREMYHDHPENVFYGTDDGYQDGSFTEFQELRDHYESVAPERRDDIHMISVVGGLYGLNLIPLWKPKSITIFDINPTAVTYFQIIHRVLISSRDGADFLERLTKGDYPVTNEREHFVQENIRLKQQGCLPRARGSTKHFWWEWRVDVRPEPMESEGFAGWIRNQNNLWIYASNITEFHYFDLEFADPSNCVVVQIIYPG